jgi:hypothetical protein
MENPQQPMHRSAWPASQGSVWSASFNGVRSPGPARLRGFGPKLGQALAALSAFFLAVSFSCTPLRAQAGLSDQSIQIRYFVVSCPTTGRPCADEPYLANFAAYRDFAVYFSPSGRVYFYNSADGGVVIQPGQKSGIFKPSEVFTFEVAVSSWTPVLAWSYSSTYRDTAITSKTTYKYRVALHDKKCSLESIESRTTADGKEDDRDRKDHVALTCRIVPGRNPFSLPPLPRITYKQLEDGLPAGFETIPKVDLPKK